MYERKEMFRATCSECGNSCEVPFKPTGSKPVLCSSCFEKQGGRSGNRDSRGGGRDFRSGGRRDFRFSGRDRGEREMHQTVCDDCGDKCEVPFRPSAGKPIYCNNCFGKHNDRGDRRGGDRRGGSDRHSGSGGNDQTAKELSSINSKLDRLINLLDPTGLIASKKDKSKKDKPEIIPSLDLDLDIVKKEKVKSVKKTDKKPAKKTVKKVLKKKK